MLSVKIGGESSPTKDLKYGHVVVGTTAVKVTPQNCRFKRSVIVRAPGSIDPVPNTVPIWIGKSGVTADSDPTTGGFPLLPGAALEIPIDDACQLSAISTAASQDLAWMGV